VLDERKARIAKGLEDARQAAVARDNADAEARRILDEARAEAAKLRAEASVQAEDTASGITAQAHTEAKEIISRAQEDAAEERNRILSDLRGQIAGISIAAANKLVGASLTEDRQHEIIGDFIARVPDTVGSMRGDTAEVTSALPLTDQEKERVRKAIKVGEVAFRVDPTILGGLVVKVGDQVVDDSVANQMSGLQESLAR
jgi:F-type H+-transporting ATPase subunit b